MMPRPQAICGCFLKSTPTCITTRVFSSSVSERASQFRFVVKQLLGLRCFQVPAAQISRIIVKAPRGRYDKNKQTNKKNCLNKNLTLISAQIDSNRSSLFNLLGILRLSTPMSAFLKQVPGLNSRLIGESRTFQICPPYLDDSNCQERKRCPGPLWRYLPSEHAANLVPLLPQHVYPVQGPFLAKQDYKVIWAP